jgi:hypothetical protein
LVFWQFGEFMITVSVENGEKRTLGTAFLSCCSYGSRFNEEDLPELLMLAAECGRSRGRSSTGLLFSPKPTSVKR